MTDMQKRKIAELRKDNYSYSRISRMLGIPLNTVKTYCRRHGLGGAVVVLPTPKTDIMCCLSCGTKIIQTEGKKQKKFCSDKCRNKWWNSHLERVNRKADYEFVCLHCKKPFTAYGNANRKYCSHQCYIANRFGGGE